MLDAILWIGLEVVGFVILITFLLTCCLFSWFINSYSYTIYNIHSVSYYRTDRQRLIIISCTYFTFLIHYALEFVLNFFVLMLHINNWNWKLDRILDMTRFCNFIPDFDSHSIPALTNSIILTPKNFTWLWFLWFCSRTKRFYTNPYPNPNPEP